MYENSLRIFCSRILRGSLNLDIIDRRSSPKRALYVEFFAKPTDPGLSMQTRSMDQHCSFFCDKYDPRLHLGLSSKHAKCVAVFSHVARIREIVGLVRQLYS